MSASKLFPAHCGYSFKEIYADCNNFSEIPSEDWPRLNWPTLTVGEIHLWAIRWNQFSKIEDQSYCLSSDELERANTFHLPAVSQKFIITQTMLRIMLGRYLDMLPSEIELSYNAAGKPSVETGNQEYSLHFNLSHSRDLTVVAFCRDVELGIDIEYHASEARKSSWYKIANRFFHPEEIST